jgi:hypothetical protein
VAAVRAESLSLKPSFVGAVAFPNEVSLMSETPSIGRFGDVPSEPSAL